MQNSTLRLFTAITIPPREREKVETLLFKIQNFPFKWTCKENLHITLKFIGNWPKSKLPLLKKQLESAKNGIFPFELNFCKGNGLPSWSKLRVLCLEGEPKREVSHLVESMETQLASIGIEKEIRPFRPHITLGRTSRKQGSLRQDQKEKLQKILEKEMIPLSFTCSFFSLYQSQLTPQGPNYTVLEDYFLKKP